MCSEDEAQEALLGAISERCHLTQLSPLSLAISERCCYGHLTQLSPLSLAISERCCYGHLAQLSSLSLAVSERCCYGKSAVNQMDIYQIISTRALHVSSQWSRLLICSSLSLVC